MDAREPRTKRAWTKESGPRIRLETRSYTTPNFSTHNDLDSPQAAAYGQPRRSFFQTAFSLLGAVQDAKRERMRQQDDDAFSRRPRRHEDYRGLRRSESDYAAESRSRDAHTRSNSSRMNDQHERPYEQTARQRSARHDRSASTAEQTTPHFGFTGSTRTNPQTHAATNDDLHIEMLQDDVLYEQRKVSECSQWLATHGHREETSDRAIQRVVTELQHHKRRLKEAKTELRDALNSTSYREAEEERPRTSRRTASRRSSQRQVPQGGPPGFDNIFSFLLGATVPPGHFRETPAFPTHANLFNQVFADLAGDHHFVFTTSRGFQAGTSGFDHDLFGEHFHGQSWQPRTAQPTPQSRARKPIQLLSVQEAKAIYQAYNEQWSTIGPADAAIPYPGRKLRRSALLDRNTTWTPTVSAPVSTWSTEDVIRVNIQSFLLAVVDMTPMYTDRMGKIEMDFDHSEATPAQLQLLNDILKKEKLRWHSDKLGRRNGGQSGVNEALQQDEVARGVFHAVCELSNLAATKR